MKAHFRRSGTGMNLTYFAGASKAFEELGITAATSANVSGSAYIGMAEASNMKADELQELILDFMPPAKKIMDARWWVPGSTWWKKGKIIGRKLERLVDHHFPTTLGETTIPFACFTSNYNTGTVGVWSSQTTPGVLSKEAVVGTGRLPGLFEPWVVDGEDHFDGGVLYNYPIGFKFAGQNDLLPTIGLLFQGTADFEYAKMRNVVEVGTRTLSLMFVNSAKEHLDQAHWAQTIVFRPKGSFLNFMRSREEAKEEMKEGREAVMRWFEIGGSASFM